MFSTSPMPYHTTASAPSPTLPGRHFPVLPTNRRRCPLPLLHPASAPGFTLCQVVELAAPSEKPRGAAAPLPPPQERKNLHTTPCLWLLPHSGAGFRQNRGPVWGVTCSHNLGALGVLGPVLQEADCRGLLHPHANNLEIQRPSKPRRGSWAGMEQRAESGPCRHPTTRVFPGSLQTTPHFQSPVSGMRDKPKDRGRLVLADPRTTTNHRTRSLLQA